MKLRLKGNEGNSLRLRVSRSEMERLARGEALEEVVRLGGGTLTYALQSSDVGELRVVQDGLRITVVVPEERVKMWEQEAEVGIYETVLGLDVLLEKDFACLDASEAENADTFSHPKSGAVC